MVEASVGRADPLRVDAKVIALRDEGGANHRLTLEVAGWPGSSPGQFVMLSPGARGAVPRTDPLLPRPMAIYRAVPRQGSAEVEILFKQHGRGTALLAAARPGEHIGLVGPLGHGFAAPEPGERAILVAGGTGIASVFELAAGLGSAARVLLGARSASDLMAVDDFGGLDARLEIATEDGSRGHRGLVTELLEAALDEPGGARVYACGPTPMMRAAAVIAADRGVPCVVSLENPMACGFGVCLGCAAPRSDGGFSLVCRDGPMFDAATIDWDRLP